MGGNGLENVPEEIARHPCFSAAAQHKFARLHLPVAPGCNISCNYCNRKYDCLNESRPGVTSEVLPPEGAAKKFSWVKSQLANLSVVGIAGPGDALADWANTAQTVKLVREQAADIIFCLSTNGLLLPRYAQDIMALGIRNVTVTVNAVDPAIGAKIYRRVNYDNKVYTGEEAARILLTNQLAGIRQLVAGGGLVKINIVMIPGINDKHIPAVVKKVKELGVLVTNIMPMISAPGSAFEFLPPTSMKEVTAMRDACAAEIPQMRHCRQCRADAVGLLGEDRSAEFRCALDRPAADPPGKGKRYKIAVTSKYGKLVDLHFGYATEFAIYYTDGRQSELVEKRRAPKYCAGPENCDAAEDRKEAIAAALKDCQAVLTMRIGYQAQERLRRYGIRSIESCYTIDHGLRQAVAELAGDSGALNRQL